MAEPPVVNASPLIVLSRAGRLDLLRVLGERILVPAAVVAEVVAHSDEAARVVQAASTWIQAVDPPVIPEAIAAWDLGAGESAVLSWAYAHPETIAVIDDSAARNCAAVLGIHVRGTLGLTLLAKRRKQIPAARPVVEELRRAGLYLSDAVVTEALSLVDE